MSLALSSTNYNYSQDPTPMPTYNQAHYPSCILGWNIPVSVALMAFPGFFCASLGAEVVKVEGCSHKQVLQVVAVNVHSRQGVTKARGESLASQHLRNIQQLKPSI